MKRLSINVVKSYRLKGLLVAWVVLSALNVVHAQSWRETTSVNPLIDLYGVHFTNDPTGYIVGTEGAIFKTTDGGIIWTAQTSNTSEALHDVYFPSVNTGFAVGENGTILKTIDGGAVWTALSADGMSTTTFFDVQFLNDDDGYIAGSGGQVIKTINGGADWTTLTSGTLGDIQGIHFTSVSTGYFVAAGGLIRKTENDGTSWSTLTIATSENLNDIFFMDANTGYVCGTNGEVWRTINAGTDWELKNDGMGSLELYGIHFGDAMNGNASSLGGWHWVTIDGAENWIAYNLQGVGTKYGTYYPSSGTGYMVAVGGKVIKYQSELEPEIQPADLAFADVYATSMRITYSASPDVPTGYIAIRKEGSAPTTDPLDGIAHNVGDPLGDGTVVFIGDATSFSESSLTEGTEYFYRIYAFNGSGTAINYKHSQPLSGSRATYPAGTPWNQVYASSVTFPSDVHFFNANVGGFAGTYNLEVTSNGGQAWASGFPSNGDSYSGVFFVSPTLGYVVGYGSGNRVIRRTVNAGVTWIDQVRATSTYGFSDVWFTSSINGIAVGDDGQIHRTTNGLSWSPVSSGTTNSLTAVHFPTATRGYAVGAGGVMLRSNNSGGSWLPTASSGIATTNDLYGTFFTGAQNGYAVGVTGTILKTTDGAATWTPQVSGTTEDLLSVHFVDANTGYVVGMNNTILKTTNGGEDWYSFTTGVDIPVDFSGVYFPTPYTGYAVGTKGITAMAFKFLSVPEPLDQPTDLLFSSMTANGVTVAFSAPSNVPDGYLVIRKAGSSPATAPLDGLEYAVGSALGDATVAYAGSSSSFDETSLAPGTEYHYMIFAYNSSGANGSTEYLVSGALSGNTSTTLVPPTSVNATSIGASDITANWSAVEGAIEYQLDVSGDGFVSFVAGYNSLVVGGTSSTVTGLSPGTSYSYRVRAVNVSGASLNSNVSSALTLPAAPTASAGTLVFTSGFTANWSATFGATGYLLDLSTNDFLSYVVGYHDLPITATQIPITGLAYGTTYQYRLRATNASGQSVYSLTINTPTICEPPATSAATSVAPTGFTANWNSVTGATNYKIDVASDPSFNFIVGSYNNLTVAETFLDVSDLTAGSTYYYRVRASNESGSSVNSPVISVLTLPAPPVASEATSVGSSTFIANWSAVATATSYRLDVSDSPGFSSFLNGYEDASVSSTSTTVTVPTEGLTYYHRVRTVNASGVSTSNSDVVSTLLKPATPITTAPTSVSGTGFTANWAAASGATSYTLEVSDDNFVSNIPGYDNVSLPGLSSPVDNLTEGIAYKYRVRAVNSAWSSAVSNLTTAITIPPAPVAISANGVTTAGFTARWSATSGATSYRIDVTADDFTTVVAGYDDAIVSGTSFGVTGLSPGVGYAYRLRAVNGSGTSENSNIVIASTLSSAPTANSSLSISSTGFTANWNLVAGASDYRLDVSTSGTFSTFEGIYNNLIVSSTSLVISGLTPGNTYYYRVRSSNSSGSSSNSNTITTLLKPATPNPTAASLVSTTGFTANWDAVAGASGYKLDVSINDFISNLAGYDDVIVSNTSHGVTGLIPGNTYKFRVRALNAAGPSASSNSIAAITVPPPPVANDASLVSTTGFTANWSTTAGISAYFLDVSTDGSFSTFLPGVEDYATSGGLHSVVGLAAGTAYYYRVRAANVSGTSANSAIIETFTLPVTPVDAEATSITSTSFTVNWSAVAGASEYRIDVSTDNNFSFYVGSYFNQLVAGTSVPVTGLSPGTVYYYRIRSSNASGSSFNSVTSNVLTLPSAPTATEATAVTSNTFVANWNPVATATSYSVDVSLASNFSSFLPGYEDFDVTSTSLVVNAPTEGTNYYYRLRAVSVAGLSSNSNTINTLLKPAAPVVNSASAVSADGFTASWLAAAGATGYYLDVSANNFSSFIAPYDNFLLAGTSVAISELSPGTNYQYRVRSYNATGSSPSSAVRSTVTVPPAPVTIQSTSFTTISFTANWLTASGAASYRLDVSTDFDFGAGSFVSGYEDLSVTGTSANVSDLVPGTIYYFRVRAVNSSGTSPNSNVTSSTNVPPPPTGLVPYAITTTTFAVSWNLTPGATGYELDLSTNNFSSFVNAYNNLSVSGTSINLVSLSPGTSYQLRLRAANPSGTSSNSVTLNIRTLPEEPASQPTAITITNVTGTTMNIAFTGSSGGAHGYLVLRAAGSQPTSSPADATAYNLGSPVGDATVAYAGSATSFNDSGLTAGTTYFYAVFAYNGNNINTNYRNASPAVASQVTVPLVPVLSASHGIGQNSFTANWSSVAGATDYALDVSDDEFTTFVDGYGEFLTGNVSTHTVTGLSGGSTYQIRLRSKNEAGVSGYSTVQSVLTIPSTPAELAAAAVTGTSFEVNWSAVSGADSYLIDLSTDENFAILIVNGATASDPEVTFSGLGNTTKYYVRVRSKNVSGVSPNSNVLTVTTLEGTGQVALTVGTPTFAPTIKTAAVPVSVSVSGGADPKTVKFHHKKLTGTSFTEIAAPLKSGNVYEVSVLPEMTDELGIEFYFSSTDANGTIDESDSHYFIHQAIDASTNTAIPFTLESFDGKAGSYQMFSIPYELSDNDIANLFEPALNGFSNTRWRLVRYVRGAFIDYPDQLKKIELGQAYWFNTIQADFQIKLGAATTSQATSQSPFEMTLDQGWNQVGDPYPFDVDWTSVQEANPNAGLSSIWKFEAGGFTKSPALLAWKGAFVFSENGGTVVFPLSSKVIPGGRELRKPQLDPTAGEWHLLMTARLDETSSEFSVGMRRDALAGKDKYDEIALPRFMNYLRVSSSHPDFFAPDFSGDVVGVDEYQTWEFAVSTNLKGSNGSISWDRSALAGLSSSVFLLDVSNQVLVNMKVADVYVFNPKDGQRLKVITLPTGEEPAGNTELGCAYPNPFMESLHIPVFIEQENSTVEVLVYTSLGQHVKTFGSQFERPGYYELEWDGSSRDGSTGVEGLLLYRVTVNGETSILRKVIKANHTR